MLRERLGKKRILLNDDQRRRLAVKGKILGRKRLREIGSLFTPDTILGWHRKLIAEQDKGDRSNIVRHSDCSDLILWRQRRLGSVWGWRDGCQDIACLSAVCDRRSVERLGSRRLQSSFGVYQRFFAASSSASFSFARCASTSSVVAQPIMWKQIIS